MKCYRALNELGVQVWRGTALNADFALIRTWRYLGYETAAQFKAAGLFFDD